MIKQTHIGDIRVSLSHDGQSNYVVAVHHHKVFERLICNSNGSGVIHEDGYLLLEELEFYDQADKNGLAMADDEYRMLVRVLKKIAGIHSFV